MNTTFLANKFSVAQNYADYLKTGTDEQQRRWSQVYDVAQLSADQKTLLGGFTREMNVLISSGIWCGDCVQQIPLLQKIAEANPQKIQLKIVDRDQHKDLADLFQINGGHRVPTVLFLAEDFEFCALMGDRTLSRYRAIARKQLGPSCPIGIAAPDQDELAATLQDWVNEFERVQLMLRLSARLRQKHGD